MERLLIAPRFAAHPPALRRTRPWRAGASLLLLGGVALLGLTSLYAETIRKKFATGESPALELRTQSGKVSVKGWDQNEIEIQGETGSDAVQVVIDEAAVEGSENKKVTVQSHPRRERLSPEEARVDLNIQVPRRASVKLQTDRGQIVVEDLQGAVMIDGVSTTISVLNVQGQITLKTVDGPIQMTASQGTIKAESISGDLKFTRVSGAELIANTNSGRIRYEGDFGQGGNYVLNNYSAPIEIFAADSASFQLTARSVQGLIDSYLTIRPTPAANAFRRLPPGKFLQGRVNSGQSTVEVNSYSGTIRLREVGGPGR